MKSRRRCRLSGDLTIIRLQLAIYFCLHRGSLNQNTARWQAFLRSIKPRPNCDRGSSVGHRVDCGFIWSFLHFAAIALTIGVGDKFSVLFQRPVRWYRLASLNRNPAAVLVSCFCVSFFLHFLRWHSADFPLFLPPFLPFSLQRRSSGKIVNWWNNQLSPVGDKFESPLANGYLIMYNSPRWIVAERG